MSTHTTRSGKLVVWRESVCAGDDTNAPHERRFSTDDRTVQSFAERLAKEYLPRNIQGGRATWVLAAMHKPHRPLAVVAQQWSEARCLVDPAADVFDFLSNTPSRGTERPSPDLTVQYLAQANPDDLFERLAAENRPGAARTATAVVGGGPR